MTPTPEEVREWAGRLGGVAEIEAVLLRALQWSTTDISVDPSEPLTVDPTYQVAHGRAGETLRFQVTSIVSGRVSAGELFRMQSVHEAFFRVPANDPASTEELEAYGSVSVFFMVFPYIREVLQGLTVNAGLPPLLLKPMRIAFDPASGAPSPAVEAALAQN